MSSWRATLPSGSMRSSQVPGRTPATSRLPSGSGSRPCGRVGRGRPRGSRVLAPPVGEQGAGVVGIGRVRAAPGGGDAAARLTLAGRQGQAALGEQAAGAGQEIPTLHARHSSAIPRAVEQFCAAATFLASVPIGSSSALNLPIASSAGCWWRRSGTTGHSLLPSAK